MSQNSELRENEQPCTDNVRKAYLLNEQLQAVLPLKHPIIQLQKNWNQKYKVYDMYILVRLVCNTFKN